MIEDWIDKEEPIEEHMMFCSKIKEKPNLIDHISEHDGIRRSLQACHIIEKFNPETAKDLADVIMENNLQRNIIGWNLPMFWDNKDLVDFCYKESQTQHDGYYSGKSPNGLYDEKAIERHNWYMQNCVAHADDVDLCADVWELSPVVQGNYPTKTKMFWGVNIGEGWLSFHADVLNEIRKRLYE